MKGIEPVLVCSTQLRAALHRLLARGRAAATRPRLHGARRAARARHDRGGEPWPASCSLRGRSSRTSSSASAPKSDPTRASSPRNRVRKGGVGGFFASEAFEVLVEPADDDGTTRPRPRRPRSRSSRNAVVEAITPRRTRDPSEPRRRHRRADRALDAAGAPTRDEARHATILELADAVSEYERNDVIDLVEERNLSTQSREFAQVLDRVSRSIDATPDETATRPRPAPATARDSDRTHRDDQHDDPGPGSEIDIRERQREAAAQVAIAAAPIRRRRSDADADVEISPPTATSI